METECAAAEDHDVEVALAQFFHHPREEREVCPGQQREANSVDVFLQCRLGDLLGRLVQPGVDDLEAGVAEILRERVVDLAGEIARADDALRPERAQRGDVILNPFMGAGARWSPFLELRDPQDARELSRAWIGTSTGESAVWHGYAETFLAAVLARLSSLPEGTPEELLRVLGSASLEELRALLSMTSAAPLLEVGNERMFGSVRAITMSRLAVLPELLRAQGPAFSVRDWVDSGRGVLFLPYRANEIATLRQVISTWQIGRASCRERV